MKKVMLVLMICALFAPILNACSSNRGSSYSSFRSSHSNDADWSGAAEAYAVGKARYEAMTGKK